MKSMIIFPKKQVLIRNLLNLFYGKDVVLRWKMIIGNLRENVANVVALIYILRNFQMKILQIW